MRAQVVVASVVMSSRRTPPSDVGNRRVCFAASALPSTNTASEWVNRPSSFVAPRGDPKNPLGYFIFEIFWWWSFYIFGTRPRSVSRDTHVRGHVNRTHIFWSRCRRVFGAKPLEDVLKNIRDVIVQDLEMALAQQAPNVQTEDPTLFELPPLVIDGIPTPVDKMAQQQLRMFIPHMLKYSTGRGKPGECFLRRGTFF